MTTDFAKAFRVIRAAYGLRQAQLAPRLGVSASQLSLIEAGKRQPSLRVITNLASTTGVPTSLIMLLASDPEDVAHEDVASLAAALLRLLVNASDDGQRALRLGR